MGLALQQARRGFLPGCRLPPLLCLSAAATEPFQRGGPVSRGETAREHLRPTAPERRDARCTPE